MYLEEFEQWCDTWFTVQIDGQKRAISQFGQQYMTFSNGYEHKEGISDLVEAGNQKVCMWYMQGLFCDKPRIIVWRRRPVFHYEFDTDRHKLTMRCHFLTTKELKDFLRVNAKD